MTNHTQTVCFFLEAAGLVLGSMSRGGRQQADTALGRRLQSIDLRLHQHQINVLLGPNGAGKSTLLQVLAGRLLADSGCIALKRQLGAAAETVCQINDLPHWQRQVGYMPENVRLLPRLSVSEILHSVLWLKTGQQDTQAVAQALDLCDLQAHADKPAQTLSLGYRQRLGLACALVHRPRILLLDEPMNGLDPDHATRFVAILNRLKAHHIILMSTHLLAQLPALGERLLVMQSGCLLGELTAHADNACDGRWRLRFEQPVDAALCQRIGRFFPVLEQRDREVVIASDGTGHPPLLKALADTGLCEFSPLIQDASVALLSAYQRVLRQSQSETRT